MIKDFQPISEGVDAIYEYLSVIELRKSDCDIFRTHNKLNNKKVESLKVGKFNKNPEIKSNIIRSYLVARSCFCVTFSATLTSSLVYHYISTCMLNFHFSAHLFSIVNFSLSLYSLSLQHSCVHTTHSNFCAMRLQFLLTIINKNVEI
jgi:hypothetical protein